MAITYFIYLTRTHRDKAEKSDESETEREKEREKRKRIKFELHSYGFCIVCTKIRYSSRLTDVAHAALHISFITNEITRKKTHSHTPECEHSALYNVHHCQCTPTDYNGTDEIRK